MRNINLTIHQLANSYNKAIIKFTPTSADDIKVAYRIFKAFSVITFGTEDIELEEHMKHQMKTFDAYSEEIICLTITEEVMGFTFKDEIITFEEL